MYAQLVTNMMTSKFSMYERVGAASSWKKLYVVTEAVRSRLFNKLTKPVHIEPQPEVSMEVMTSMSFFGGASVPLYIQLDGVPSSKSVL